MKKLFFCLINVALLYSAPTFAAGVKVYNIFEDVIPQTSGRTKICTMTINSADEKKAFIEQSRKTDEEVDYIELTPQTKGLERNTWLKSVCQKLTTQKISCDKLILSAHFGPRFYGDSRKELDLDYLESLSCSSYCSSLFSKLKETYLFTCNSMSGIADDKRRSDSAAGLLSSERNSTRQNYVAIQIAHDASRSWAEEAAEARYGDFSEGGTFGERFLLAFGNIKNGHRIYGFTGVSDAGASNAKYIRQSFAQNRPLEDVMKSRKMVKRSGHLSLEEQNLKKWSCAMATEAPHLVVPALVKKISSSQKDQRQLYGRLIRFFMDNFTRIYGEFPHKVKRTTLTEQPWFKTLQNIDVLKDFTIDGLSSNEFPSSARLRWSSFAYHLDWISKSEHNSFLSQGLYGLMKPPYNAETNDDVLHYAKLFPMAVKNLGPVPSSLKANNLSRYKVEELLGILKSRY